MIQDPSSMESMRDRCHQVYEAHFSRATSIRQWNDILKEIVAEG
jgi:glycosyltransferase involved in cell wall biosynthesis